MSDTIKVYDLKEVASILKINIRVLRRYINENKIKASKVGRKYVITAEDLDAYLKGNSNDFYKHLESKKENEEAITEEDKALLEEMLVKADIGKETINLESKDNIEASLNELFNLQFTTEEIIRGVKLVYNANLINGYKKTPAGYEVELNKDLVKKFKENMLINTKIVKK